MSVSQDSDTTQTAVATASLSTAEDEKMSESIHLTAEAPTSTFHAVGEEEARQNRLRYPTATLFVVEALTLARDGGILDWDDRVCDVLDDRELASGNCHRLA